MKVAVTNELMRQADLVIATGGAGMVKAAYSSGTPAYGVGAGNAIMAIDDTADFKDAAHKIMLSKTATWLRAVPATMRLSSMKIFIMR